MKRTLITLIVVGVGLLFAVALVVNSVNQPAVEPGVAESPEIQVTPESLEAAPPVGAVPQAQPTEFAPLTGLRVVGADRAEPAELGSMEPGEDNPFMFRVELAGWGASLQGIYLSKYSIEVPEVGGFDPYPIQQKLPVKMQGGQTAWLYPMAANWVRINDGQPLYLLDKRWELVEEQTDETRATYRVTVVDGQDRPVLRIVRTYRLEPGRYDLFLDQRFENLIDQPLKVVFSQYAQGDMPLQKGYMGDRRQVVMGYFDIDYDPQRLFVYSEEYATARTSVVDDVESLWPVEGETDLELVWPAMTNRYFLTALHQAVVSEGGEARPVVKPLEAEFNQVEPLVRGTGDNAQLMLMTQSRPLVIAPGGQGSLDVALFAGPKKPELLAGDPVYDTLGLDELIIYNLGGPCAFCTFAWLGEFLLGFLKLLHFVVRDWGVAIILLVAVVRTLLHPLTKKAQLNMMRMGKQMQSLQPEIERLKKKYGNDQQKLNMEMMKLYREKGINPAAGLGCLPMFLQMPIWFALYAVLYFAIELRQVPAFYNVFHELGELVGVNWQFLTDLSQADHFITFPGEGFTLNLFFIEPTFQAINLLPILMIFVFWAQQKYMATTPTQSAQAAQQQKMMKFMVLLFPIFLYSAPSGLTLYILTSTAAGVVESRRIRRHLEEEEKAGTLFRKEQKQGDSWVKRIQSRSRKPR